jgi:glycogen debranching enzyme
MPLYAGTITKKRAEILVGEMLNPKSYWLHHPVPSVPLNNWLFEPKRYWQGPSWVNTNWFIIDGLRRYGFDKEAEELTAKTLEMVNRAGSFEYFNPLDGQGIGAPEFSWTAALTIDLIKTG